MAADVPAYRLQADRLDWETPQGLFDALHTSFGFTLDVCALPSTAKCSRYFTPDDDALAQDWDGICWMNPPYGRGVGAWLKKAHESACAGATVVCLVPVRSDVAWWHDYAMKHEIVFLKGRLYFRQDGERKSAAAFPCALIIMRPQSQPVLASWCPTKEQRG